MIRSIVPALLMLAACSSEQEQVPDSNETTNVVPAPAPSEPAPPPDTNVASEEPFAPTSAQGAANVVQTYYALLEAKKFVEAHKLWTTGVGDLADETFAAQFANYREYHAEVGAPGRIEGAAGSLYVTVPVRTYGVTKAGERFEQPGVVTLRRVNDVPGSTDEQRRWHITKIDSPPEPH